MATIQEKQDYYAALLNSVDLINQIDSDAPNFDDYGDSNTASEIVTVNKDHLVASKADSDYWDSAPAYDPGWDSVNSAVTTATAFLVTHPYTAPTPDSEAPVGSVDWLKDQATILDQATTLINNIDSDAPNFDEYGDSGTASQIVSANKDHIDQIKVRSDSAAWTWGDSFDSAQWASASSTATSFLVTYPLPAADSEAPEGSADWWTARYNGLRDTITAVNTAATETDFGDSERIDILNANQDYQEAELLREDSYTTQGHSLDSVEVSYGNTYGSILNVNSELTSGFLVRRYDSYFGSTVDSNDSNYQSLWRTESPTSTAVWVNVDLNENDPKQSRELNGYFKATNTGSHTFYLNTDDFGYMWVSGGVFRDSGMATADVSNPGTHGAQERSVTVHLDSGNYMPIKIRYGNVGSGPAVLEAYYEHSGQAKTSDWTGRIFHNVDSSNDGL